MKIKLLGLCLATATMIAGFNAVAEDDHRQGGPINGVENLQVLVRFVATSNAPAGASGVLRLKARNRTDTNTSSMRITTRRLVEGLYDVTATLKSTGGTISLGQITLTNGLNTNAVLVSESDVELPADVSAMDIATVTISNSSGAILFADLVTAPGNSLSLLNARVRVTSTSTNAPVSGTAVLHSTARKGKQRGSFVMVVRGLAPSTTYDVLVNGAAVRTARTGRNGGLIVRRLPVTDFSSVTSVQLRDQTSTIIAEADF